MDRRWIVIGIAAAVVVLAGAIYYGCGQAAQQAATPTTKVTISGVVTASQADLAQLGVTALAVGEDQSKLIRSMGVSEAHLKHIVSPMAVGDATVSVGTLKSDGSIDTVATAKVVNGSYSVEIDYDSTKTYGVVVTKTSSDTNKTLELKAILPAPTNNEIKGDDAAVSSKTTLITDAIVEKVTKVLESAQVDANVVKQVKEVIIETINTLIESGAISMPSMVKEATETENKSAKDVANIVGESGQAKYAIDSLKFKAGFDKATSLSEAKGVIKEIFTGLIGDPRGMPEDVIEGLASELLKGSSKTIAEIAVAEDAAVYNSSTNQTASGNITASGLIALFTEKLNQLYSVAGEASTQQLKNVTLDQRLAVYLAVFPKSEWQGKTLTAATAFNIPQIIIALEAGLHALAEAGKPNLIYNPAKAMVNLFPGIISDTVKIMHSEVRVVSYFDPQNPEGGGTPALESWIEVGNMVDFNDSSQVAGVSASLTYTKTDGSSATVNYNPVTFSGPQDAKATSIKKYQKEEEGQFQGPPPGMKQFNISPWEWGGTKTLVIDFKGGTTATIKALKNGEVIDTKTATIPDIANFLKIQTAWKVPKQTFDYSNADVFPEGSSPILEWTAENASGNVPSAYRLAYALMIFKRGTYGEPFYQSWDKQEFIEGTTFPISATGKTLSKGEYDCEIATVLIEKDAGWPVAEGGRAHTTFKVGTEQEAIQQTGTATLAGTVTMASDITAANVRVGLFHAETWGNEALSPIVSAVSLNSTNQFTIAVELTDFTKYGRYEIRAWSDNGDGKLACPPIGTEFFAPAPKDISKQGMGLMTFDPTLGYQVKLSESATGFDINMSWMPKEIPQPPSQ